MPSEADPEALGNVASGKSEEVSEGMSECATTASGTESETTLRPQNPVWLSDCTAPTVQYQPPLGG